MYEDIEFESMATVDPDTLLSFYRRLNHPTTSSIEKLKCMIDNTFCFVTARCEGELIGIARGVSDGLCGRLADCKLDPDYQGPACVTRTDGRIEDDSAGIAAEMARRVIEELRSHGVEKIHVQAYGTEVDFCEEVGFQKVGGVVVLELSAGVPVAEHRTVAAGESA